MMPARIQRKRTPGWRLPTGAIIVDRTSRLGNPFRIEDAEEANYSNPRSAVVSHHRAWLKDTEGAYGDICKAGAKTFDRRIVLASLGAMRGHDLACTCAPPAQGEPDLCHAVTLIELANAPRPRTKPVRHPGGGGRITVQRCCNGCAAELGDATEYEMNCAIAGRDLPDVRGECPACSPAGDR